MWFDFTNLGQERTDKHESAPTAQRGEDDGADEIVLLGQLVELV